MDGFDTTEIDDFRQQILEIAKEKMPKESKKFLRKEGNTLKKEVKAYAKTVIKPSGGKVAKEDRKKKYLTSIKRGRPYDAYGNLCVRVYSYAPHAHLIEHGHRQVVNPGKGKGNGKGVIPGEGIGREVGFVPGYYIFSSTTSAYEDDYFRETEEFIDSVLEKGLS